MPHVIREGSRNSVSRVQQDILDDEECSAILVDSALPIARIDQNIRKIICGQGSLKMNVSPNCLKF